MAWLADLTRPVMLLGKSLCQSCFSSVASHSFVIPITRARGYDLSLFKAQHSIAYFFCAIGIVASSAATAECYESSIVKPSPFMGTNEEIFKLADGTLWEVKYEYRYLYAYSPNVTICPDRGRLFVEDEDEPLAVAKVGGSSSVRTAPAWELYEETQLSGSINGTIEKGHIFKTVSGHVYEVTGITLQLVLELSPDVTVLRNGNTYKLVVEGFDDPLICERLK